MTASSCRRRTKRRAYRTSRPTKIKRSPDAQSRRRSKRSARRSGSKRLRRRRSRSRPRSSSHRRLYRAANIKTIFINGYQHNVVEIHDPPTENLLVRRTDKNPCKPVEALEEDGGMPPELPYIILKRGDKETCSLRPDQFHAIHSLVVGENTLVDTRLLMSRDSDDLIRDGIVTYKYEYPLDINFKTYGSCLDFMQKEPINILKAVGSIEKYPESIPLQLLRQTHSFKATSELVGGDSSLITMSFLGAQRIEQEILNSKVQEQLQKKRKEQLQKSSKNRLNTDQMKGNTAIVGGTIVGTATAQAAVGAYITANTTTTVLGLFTTKGAIGAGASWWVANASWIIPAVTTNPPGWLAGVTIGGTAAVGLGVFAFFNWSKGKEQETMSEKINAMIENPTDILHTVEIILREFEMLPVIKNAPGHDRISPQRVEWKQVDEWRQKVSENFNKIPKNLTEAIPNKVPLWYTFILRLREQMKEREEREEREEELKKQGFKLRQV